jgi:hypothetical protein
LRLLDASAQVRVRQQMIEVRHRFAAHEQWRPLFADVT